MIVPIKRVLSKARAAQYVGVHINTLRKMDVSGELPAVEFHGRRVYLLEDLDRYINSLPRFSGHKKKPK